MGKRLEFILDGLKARSTKDFYERAAGIYDDVCSTQDAWTRMLLQDGPPVTWRALDIACGTGASTAVLGERSARVTGVDFSENMLRRARERLPGSQYRFVRGDFLRLPVADASVTLACCVGGTRHVPRGQEGRFLDEAYRVLKPGGLLVIPAHEPTVIQKAYGAAYNLFMRVRGLDERIAYWTPERTEGLLRCAGFEPVLKPLAPRAYAAWGVKR